MWYCCIGPSGGWVFGITLTVTENDAAAAANAVPD